MKQPINHLSANVVYRSAVRPANKSTSLRHLSLVAVTGLLIGAAQVSVQGQAHQVWAQYVRLTVPTGVGGTITNTINVITSNTVTPVVLTVEAPLPTGVVSAILVGTNNFLDQFPDPDLTPDGTMDLVVTYDGTVPQSGLNEISVVASSGYNYRLPVPIHSGKVWAGSTNSPAWSTAANWSSSGAPGAGDLAVFTSAGANDHGTNSFTNVVVSTSQNLGGLRFMHGDAANDENYGIEIKAGVTLAVTGTNGFSYLQDTIGSAGNMGVNFFGAGSLLVSNAISSIALLHDGNQRSDLDMGQLANFKADVDRLGLGDYLLYPYYRTNGYSVRGGSAAISRPSRWIPWVTLAKTNYIRATHVDANNYTNAEVREYALSLVNNENQGGSSADTQRFLFLLGRNNTFLMDSIVVGGSVGKGESATRGLRFNTDTNVIPSGVIPAALFRGVDGISRMSVFAVSDNAGPDGAGSSSKGIADFSGGTVDALVDRLYIGRDRQECKDNDSANGTLVVGAGVFDVNTLYVSAQEQGNNSNPDAATISDPSGEVNGTLTVTTNGVVRVNDTLHVGYTTADPGDYRRVEEGSSEINLNNGGRLLVNNILVGGVTKASRNNRISINSGANLIVTNRVGQADKWLDELSMGDAILTLHLDGSSSDPYVYATNIVTSGIGNTINVTSVVNVVSFPSTFPLIQYQDASPNFSVVMPPGYYGFIINNTANKTIDVRVVNTAPQNRVWRGTPTSVWDTSSPNWQGDQVFADGDTATLDDTATTTSISVPGIVYAGGSGVLVSNNTKAYTLSGGGGVSGTAPMAKWGTNSLTVNVISELPLTINQGSVTGSGALGSTTVKSNTSLSFSGAINRLTTSGTTTLLTGSTVANGLNLNAGSMTDSGSVTGTVSVASGTTLHITSGGKITKVAANTTSTINADSMVTLDGSWTLGLPAGSSGQYTLSLFGTMIGTGGVRVPLAKQDLIHVTGNAPAYWTRLGIGSGGVLSPGAVTNQITVFTNEAQLDFGPGSRIIIDVNMDSVPGSNPKGNAQTLSSTAKNSDVIFTSRWSTRTGTLRMNRLGTTPWTNGTVIKVLGKNYETFGYRNRVFDGVTNQFPVMDPLSPGLGLLWDLSEFSTNGIVRVASGGPTTPPVLTNSVVGTTITLSWDTNYVGAGWQLAAQTNSLEVGLTGNWYPIPGTESTSTYDVTIDPAKPTVFYTLRLGTD